jgi:pimeloyl-ACP methyl ester carboxylesterase
MDVFDLTTRTAHVELEYQLAGSGDPVVMLHARPFVTWYGPLVEVLPAWTVLRPRRLVRAGGGAYGLGDDAEAVIALLRHVGLDRAHIVGHSYGGLVALAVAMLDRSVVRSLTLIEPASIGFLAPPDAEVAVAPLLATYRADGPDAAMDQFLRLVGGDDVRPRLDSAVPGAYDDAVAHAPQFFDIELPAVARWSCPPEELGPITEPVLNVLGSETAPRFAQGADLIQRWLPHAVRETVAGTNHLLIAERPTTVGALLEAFWRAA